MISDCNGRVEGDKWVGEEEADTVRCFGTKDDCLFLIGNSFHRSQNHWQFLAP